jgi:cytochrome c2
MSNEITHILRGVFLFIVLAIFIRLFTFVTSIHTQNPEEKITVVTQVGPAPLSELAQRGKVLFKENCAACHALHKDMTGPSLVGVVDRWPSKKLLYMWINNWSKAVATGDPYAIKVRAYSNASMTTFNFTDDEIDSILVYINESTKEVPSAIQ